MMTAPVESTVQQSLLFRKSATFYTLIFCLFLIAGLWVMPSIAWRGTPPLHITLEFIAGLLAIVIAAGSMVRYIALEQRRILFFGLSFLGAGIADMYHAVIAIQAITGSAGTDPTSWTAGRDIHAFLLIASLIVGRYAPRAQNIRMEIVATVMATVVFTVLMLLWLDRYIAGFLGVNMYPFGWLSQWPSSLLFLISAWGYWRLYVAQRMVYLDWATGSILILCTVQVYAALNLELNDMHFYAEHVLKDLAYLVALCGLYLESFILFRNLEQERTANARYRAVIEATSDNVIVADITGTILLANRSAHDLLGYDTTELIGRPLTAIIPEHFRDAHRAGIQRYRETRVARVMEQPLDLSALRKDNGEVPVELTLSATGSGQEEQFIAIFRDITERKQVEDEIRKARDAAQDASRAKSEFLASMSHEIRTPMNGVIGMIGLLMDTRLSPEQKEYAQVARQSADILLAIINDILDFSKIEAGKLTIEPMPFDLRLAVEEVADMMAVRAEEKNLDLVVRYDFDAPLRVIGDPGRIRQVLINLTSNAIKFTHKGHVLINVEREAAHNGTALIRVSVEDTGIGIPEDKLEHIFEKFTQADASTTRQYGGTGLGLAISRRLIELMGGIVGVTSKAGAGSTFWFTATLPLDTGAPPAPLPQADLTEVRILIVDDHDINRRVLTEWMTNWHIRHKSVSSGKAALDALRTAHDAGDPFQMVLLDYQMPDMDGAMLGRIIKADPALQKTILVMLSSIGQRGEVEGLTRDGFAAYIVKPIRQSKLMDILSTVWGTWASNTEGPFITRHTVAESQGAVNASPPYRETSINARVLVTEDNIVNQKVAVRILEKLGCRVDVAANGLEAVNMLDLLPYDLVFMDCQMPEMDGYEATAEIKRRQDRCPPIVAMTASALQGDRERCLAAGMDDYISKPVRAEDMEAALKRWVRSTAQPSDEGEAAPESGTGDTPALLNPDVIAGLRELDDETFLTDFFRTFQNDALEQLKKLRQASEVGDAVTLKKIAHTLKGSSLNIGAEGMAAQCQHLEDLPADQPLTGVGERIERLEQEVARVIDELIRLKLLLPDA